MVIKVHTYHINIDVGDSAIHLLVDEAIFPPSILRAVLIDGGVPGVVACNQIKSVICRIEARYSFDPNGQPDPTHRSLRFDSVVITHWDRDHYGGVIALLLDGYQNQLDNDVDIATLQAQSATAYNTAVAGGATLTREQTEAFDQLLLSDELQLYQSKYLKYDGGPPVGFPNNPPNPLNASTGMQPLSTLYAPYQYVTKINRTSTPPVLTKKSLGVGSPASKTGGKNRLQCNQGGQYRTVIPMTPPNDLDIAVSYQYQRSWPVNPSNRVMFFRFAAACQLVAHYEGYLGAELFTNTLLSSRPTPNTPNLMTTPLQLIEKHGIQVGDGPRLFIVAGAQVIIGNTPLAVRAAGPIVTNALSRLRRPTPQAKTMDEKRKIPPHQVKIVDERIGPVPPIDVTRTGSIPKNSPSICCMILTRTETPTGFAKKHFFAGDALWDVEGAVVNWATLRNAPGPPALPDRIPFLKLSHHGAKVSTPTSLLENFKPKRIIIPNGSMHRFGHPRWEIIFYILALIEKLEAEVLPAGRREFTYLNPPVYTLYPPIYFRQPAGKPLAWSVKSFFAVTAQKLAEIADPTVTGVVNEDSAYAANLINCLDAASIATNSPLHLWKAWQTWRSGGLFVSSTAGKAAWMVQKMGSYWGRISRQTAPNVTPVTVTPLLALKLVIGEDETGDRITFLDPSGFEMPSFAENNNLVIPPPTPPPPPPTPPPPPPAPPPVPVLPPPPPPIVAPRSLLDTLAQRSPSTAALAASTNAGQRKRGLDQSDTGISPKLPPKRIKDSTAPTSQSQLDRLVSSSSDVMDESTEDEEAGDLGPVTTSFTMDIEASDVVGGDEPEDSGGGDMEEENEEIHRTRFAVRNKQLAASPNSTISAPNSGTLRAVVLATAPPPVDSFTIYSRLFAPLTAPVSNNEGVLGAGAINDALDDFISVLQNAYLTLDSSFGATATIATISANDEYMQKLSAMTGVQQFSLKGVLQNGDVFVQDMVGGCSALGGMTFSLAAASVIFSPTRYLNPGFMTDHNMLVLGLQPVPSTNVISLSDIFLFFDFTPAADVFTLDSSAVATPDLSISSRSGLYLQSNEVSTTWLRLAFTVDLNQIQHLLTCLGADPTMISNVRLTGRKRLTCDRNGLDLITRSNSRLILQADINLGTSVGIFTAYLTLSPQSTQLNIRFHAEQHIDDMLDWLLNLFNTQKADSNVAHVSNDDVHPSKLLPSGASDAVAIRVQDVSILLQNPTVNSSFKFENVSLTLELDIYSACFFVTVSLPKITLIAALWEMLPLDDDTQRLPYMEDFQHFTPFSTIAGVLDLKNIFPGGNSMPPGIPSIVTEARLQINIIGDEKIFLFTGSIDCADPGAQSVPMISMSDLTLSALYDTKKVVQADGTFVSQSAWDVKLSTMIVLYPRDWSIQNPECAKLEISVEYNNGAWIFIAATDDLSFSALYSLFDNDANDSVMNLLESFWIPSLTVQYDYTSGQASTLSVNGSLIIGQFELDLAYIHTGTQWTLQAHIGLSGSESHPLTTLLAGLDASLAQTMSEVPFVNNITIPSTTPTQGGYDHAPIQLFVSKTSTGVLMWLRLEIDSADGNLSLLFVQHQANAPQGTTVLPAVKRLLRIKVDKLPSLPSIPVVGSLPQPFDSIDYIWVSSDSTVAPGTPTGFTRAELVDINLTLVGDEIPFRDPAVADAIVAGTALSDGPPASGSVSNILLLSGHHFIVVTDQHVVIDHIFGTQPPSQTTGPVQASVARHINPPSKMVVRPRVKAAATSTDGGVLQQDSGATHGSTKLSFGPLTIQSIGLQTKDGNIFILVDATIALGPIQLTLVGFGIGLPLKDLNLNTLKHLPIEDFQIELSGMSVYFNQPPVLIAGVFIDGSDATQEFYEGGLALSMLPYTLLAVGAYRHQKPPAEDFKSVFVFARLDGPLFTLEFAEISGVEAGFGYNYDITMPKATQVTSFPLVEGIGVSSPPASSTPPSLPSPSASSPNNPMTLLQQFNTWVTPRNSYNWLAIGFKVDAFRVLTVDAAAIVALGPQKLLIAVVGMASASMPPHVPDPREAILYIELAISIVLDIDGGELRAEAQLTPNSFLLHPDCHLTGGFSLCYWFKGSPYEGDFVFTVGGYHPAFKAPSYYPNPDRLGISWNLSDVLTIRGEAFFAVTPKACMAGGKLVAAFNAGPIYANFTAWAMFLVIYKPFWFMGDIGISITVGFHLDLGLISLDFHGTLGADVHLTGPPFGGYADIDLTIHRFTIYFGDQGGGSPALNWVDFQALVMQPGPGDTPAPTTSTNTTSDANPNMVVVALVTGSADEKTSSPKPGPDDHWFVRSGTFSFRVESKFALTAMQHNMEYSKGIKTLTWAPNPPLLDDDQTLKPYARAMHQDTPITSSTLVVTVTRLTDIGAPVTTVDPDNLFNIMPMYRQVPLALWGKYTQDEDPTVSQYGNNIPTLLDGQSTPSTTNHLMGFTFSAPDPQLPPTPEQLPEFNARSAMLESVIDIADLPNLPPTPPAQTHSLPGPMTASRDGPLNGQNWTTATAVWNTADPVAASWLASAWTGLLGWADQSKSVAPLAVSSAATSSGDGGGGGGGAGGSASNKTTGGGTTTTTTTTTTDPAPPIYPANMAPFAPLQANRPQHLIDALGVYYLAAPTVSAVQVGA